MRSYVPWLYNPLPWNHGLDLFWIQSRIAYSFHSSSKTLTNTSIHWWPSGVCKCSNEETQYTLICWRSNIHILRSNDRTGKIWAVQIHGNTFSTLLIQHWSAQKVTQPVSTLFLNCFTVDALFIGEWHYCLIIKRSKDRAHKDKPAVHHQVPLMRSCFFGISSTKRSAYIIIQLKIIQSNADNRSPNHHHTWKSNSFKMYLCCTAIAKTNAQKSAQISTGKIENKCYGETVWYRRQRYIHRCCSLVISL